MLSLAFKSTADPGYLRLQSFAYHHPYHSTIYPNIDNLADLIRSVSYHTPAVDKTECGMTFIVKYEKNIQIENDCKNIDHFDYLGFLAKYGPNYDIHH